MDDKKFLKADDIAEIFGISRSKAYRMMRLGEIPTIKIGEKNLRVRTEDLQEYILARRYTEQN